MTNGTTGSASTDGWEMQAYEDDFYILGREAAGDIIMYPANSEAMRIDSSGYVGINYTNPSLLGTLAVVQKASGKGIALVDATLADTLFLENNTSQSDIRNNTTKPIVFSPNNAERMRIDSSGNVGIGISDPSGVRLYTSAVGSGDVTVTRDQGVDGSDYHYLDTVVSPAENLVKFKSTGASNGGFTFNNSSSEYMRLDASGNLLVGQSTSTAPASSNIIGAAISPLGYISANRTSVSAEFGTQGDGDIVVFRDSGTAVGSIGSRAGVATNLILYPNSGNGSGITGAVNGIAPIDETGGIVDGHLDLGGASYRWKDIYLSGTANAANFNTTSDATLKTNVETLTGSLDKVKALRGVSYDWIESGGSEIGVIAQEVEAVIPDVVSTNDEGIKSVKYGNMVAVLIEAIKEQQAQIDELKAQLNS